MQDVCCRDAFRLLSPALQIPVARESPPCWLGATQVPPCGKVFVKTSHQESPEARVDKLVFEDAPDLFQDKRLHFAYIFQHLFT